MSQRSQNQAHGKQDKHWRVFVRAKFLEIAQAVDAR